MIFVSNLVNENSNVETLQSNKITGNIRVVHAESITEYGKNYKNFSFNIYFIFHIN